MDTSSLPDWWRNAVREFERYDLKPYKPPVFSDGTPKYRVVREVEREHGVEIRFVGVGATHGDPWQVRVDGAVAGHVARRRRSDGRTVYEVSGDEFRTLVADHLE